MRISDWSSDVCSSDLGGGYESCDFPSVFKANHEFGRCGLLAARRLDLRVDLHFQLILDCPDSGVVNVLKVMADGWHRNLRCPQRNARCQRHREWQGHLRGLNVLRVPVEIGRE